MQTLILFCLLLTSNREKHWYIYRAEWTARERCALESNAWSLCWNAEALQAWEDWEVLNSGAFANGVLWLPGLSLETWFDSRQISLALEHSFEVLQNSRFTELPKCSTLSLYVVFRPFRKVSILAYPGAFSSSAYDVLGQLVNSM